MTDNAFIRDYYEQQPYPDRVFHFTHPAHCSAVAQLYGHPQPPAPASARILDMGCGQGANLRNIARDLPDAQCLGIDLSAKQIQSAREQAQAEGLDNVEFICADILQHDFGNQRFDYIIAHGFFAWVPDEVKERFLSLCREQLSSNGIAFISYNCLPGWSIQEGLRLLMQMENELEGNQGRDLLKGADRVSDFFSKTLPAVKQLPHTSLLHHEIENLRHKERDIVLHDELEPINEPLYLLQFAQWAQGFDLSYIGDNSLMTDWLEIYPKEIKQAMAEQRMSRLQALQYADFLFNRNFRRSLLAHANLNISGNPTAQQLRGLHIASRLRQVEANSNTYQFIPDKHLNSAPSSQQVSDPLAQAFLNQLAQTLGEFQPLETVVSKACRHCQVKENDKAWAHLGDFVLKQIAQDFLRVSLGGMNSQR